MAKPRHLKNAPIVEAIIDLRVKLPSTFDITRFSSLRERLRDDYPKMEQTQQIQFEFQVRGKQFQQTLKDKGLEGYFFKSDDSKNVAQFKRDGFTFSRLQPYTEWDTVLAEAKRLWKSYVTKASPELVTRIAVRYINRMNIPLPVDDFAEYLTAPPTVPNTLPQAVSLFMTRVTICDEERGIFANITQALQKGAKPDFITIILDIDVYKPQDKSMTGGFEESKIWPTFEQLRELKNRIFFDSITEKTARLFE